MSTEEADAALFDALDAALDAVIANRKWILTDTVLVPAARLAERLVRRGAQPPLLLACQPGTGDPPDAEVIADALCLDLPPEPNMLASVRSALSALAHLPDWVQARIDAYDPKLEARVLGPIFDLGRPVGGRAVFGARQPAWMALEDKVTIDAVWDACQIARAPCRVVPVSEAALDAAAAELDEGFGTVWAADMREGFNGGAQGTFHVHDAASRGRALTALQAQCDRARVMPFLEGLPCSIHGLVFPDHVVTTRPAELLTLRFTDGRGFLYGRSSSAWWPGEAIVETMREVAVRAGRHIRDTLGYRGAFTVDGVWTREGFRPTELNPRVGAALGQVMPGIDAYLVHCALVEGVDLGVDPRALEAALRRTSMKRWVASSMVMVQSAFSETQERALRWTGQDWTSADDDQAHDATVRWGPAGTGGIVFCFFNRDTLPFGPSVAPKAAAFVRWADENLHTCIGPVSPAPWPA